MNQALNDLAYKLAAENLDSEDLVLLAGCTLAKTPGKKDNWIEAVGGELPEYICEVARSIHRKRGVPTSQAISIAIGVMKNWASGRGDVNADTRAKAGKAIAQWEALKAKAKAKRAAK